jgi:hypothetical protein
MTSTHGVGMAMLVVPIVCAMAGCGESAVQPPEPRVEAVEIQVMSEPLDVAKAGEPLRAPFVIRVRGSDGQPLPGARLRWAVTEGSGHVLPGPAYWPGADTLSDQTGTDGTSRVWFRPTAVGAGTITATLYGSNLDPVRFHVQASALVIHNEYWGYFLSPDLQPDATVPVGTPVEWLNRRPVLVEIFSAEEPEGAQPFRAVLSHDQRLRFVPDVAGSWVWRYRYIDETGAVIELDDSFRTLTAVPHSP